MPYLTPDVAVDRITGRTTQHELHSFLRMQIQNGLVAVPMVG